MKFWTNYVEEVRGYQGLKTFQETFKRIFMIIWEYVNTLKNFI